MPSPCTTSAPELDGGGDRGRVHVDDHVLAAGVVELRGDAAADAAEAADDGVVTQLVDGPSPPSLSEVLPDDAARDQLDDRARKVEEDCHARQKQDHGEELGGVPSGRESSPVSVVVTTAR